MAMKTDILVIGSGVAGLTLALDVADHADVVVLSKRALDDTNTRWAQGGIAVVMDDADSPEQHKHDTMVAGAGLCHEVTVDLCCREGPSRLAELIARGARFDREPEGDLSLTREGGHGRRRVVHHHDATGEEVQRVLVARARAHPNIRLLEHHFAIDLVMLTSFGGPDQCVGAYVLDGSASTSEHAVVETILARGTALATGGAGKVYLYTSNPDVATGDGVAMAFRAGAEIANMEFYQFHPTCLFHPQERSFLITEALRGEGATLRLPDAAGTPFMTRHDARGDLAPRDVVARAIDYEMKRAGFDFVHLDITNKAPDWIRERFPTIFEKCAGLGLDITTTPIPVVPAAHYMCGGITTNTKGRTSIPGLYAVGETSFTGLHGANRLASNSLLEGMVFGHRTALHLRDHVRDLRGTPHPSVPDWRPGDAQRSDEGVVVAHNWDELRRTMWNYVGIVRSDRRLRRAARRIAMLQDEIQAYYWETVIGGDLLELRNIATVAELIVGCAAARKESRGLHHTTDYPDVDPELVADTIVKRGVPAHHRRWAPRAA
ncbi:MAG: L-aspartate oxidase [Myxococcota bacterium]